MKHRFVLTVVAEKGNVLAEVHVFQVIRDKTAVTALDTLAKLRWVHLIF